MVGTFFAFSDRLNARPRLSTWAAQVAVAVVAVAVATGARWVVFQVVHTRLPYLTFFPAVLTAALLGGWRAGTIATALSIFPAAVWTDPARSWTSFTTDGLTGTSLYLLTCAYSVAVADWALRSRAREAGAREGARRAGQRLREFIENIDDGFAAFDRAWTILYANRAAKRMVGLGSGTLIGKRHWELFPESRDGPVWEAYDRAVRERVPVHVELFYPPLDKWLSIHAYPTEEGLSVFFQDVSERVRGEQATRAADATFRAAVDAGRIGIWDWDIQADRVTWSDRIYELHGLRPGEFAGTVGAFGKLIHPDDYPLVRREMERAMSELRPYVAEFRAVLPDGGSRWLQTHGRVLFDAGGKPARLLGAVVDVTDRKRADEAKARMLADERALRSQAEHASRMKDEFLATLSHELRTPLNAILGWAQLLLNGGADARDLSQGLSTIERNARLQTQLIEDLLDMSRVIAGKLHLDVRPVDLRDVVEAAVATVGPAAAAKSIRIEPAVDARAGLVNGDAARLQQVAWNLLNNAVKFTPRGGRVRVRLGRVGDHVELSVADTGEGVAAEFLPYVFDRFRQADASSTRRHGGLGLGLAIVKSLVETHGGVVRATSEGKGLGSTFTVQLPLAIAGAPGADGNGDGNGDGDGATTGPAEDRSPAAAREALPAAGGRAVSLAGVRVLVVDDEPDSRLLVRKVLEESGAEVTDAATAADGLARLAESHPDVILSDIGMPEVDGYEFIARVRKLADGAGGRTPAIALTAFARTEDRTRALLAGYLVHVSKPVEPVELIATVASVTGRTGAAATAAQGT
jgi:PAS domain S-box-containing protein